MIAWDLLAGFGIISDDRGRKAISFLLAAESTAVPPQSSFILCVDWLLSQLNEVVSHLAGLFVVQPII